MKEIRIDLNATEMVLPPASGEFTIANKAAIRLPTCNEVTKTGLLTNPIPA